MTGTVLRLRVMGPLRAWHGDAEIDLGPRQQRSLLALLMARNGHPVGMSDLIALIWGADAPASAVNVIHKYVGALRRLLEPGLPLRVPGSYLQRGVSGYRFTAGPQVLDLAGFRDLVATGRAYAGADRPAEALDAYTGALRHCRGPAGDSLADTAGASATFAAIDSEFFEAAIAAAELAVRLGRPGPVLAPLRLAAGMSPLNEPVHASLITVLARAGHQAEALEAYRTIRQRLVDDLGIDPGHALQEAHRRVLTPDPLPEAERTAILVRPAQLPPDLPFFVGRNAELDTLGELADGMCGDHRSAPLIVSLDGMGGVGKSTLAAHFAHRQAARFTDGQLYLDLKGDLDEDENVRAGDALGALLYALGVPVAQLPDTFDARVGAYRSLTAGRRILVLLDNVRDPAQVRPLLPNSAASLVLLTSRRPLLGLAAFDGAHLLRIEVPDLPSAQELIRRRLADSAGRLVGDGQRAVIDEIIELCGRLPLALAILSARLVARPGLSLETVAADLRDGARRLHAFPAGIGAPDPRTAFSWSYRQLSPDAARLFRLLSVALNAGISAAACASLSGGDPERTRAELDELAEAALIDEHDSGCFTSHVLVKAYAEELLSSVEGPAERRAAVARLLQHYLHSGRNAWAALRPDRAVAGAVPPDGVRPERPATPEQAAAWLTGHRDLLAEAARLAADLGEDAADRQLTGYVRALTEPGGAASSPAGGSDRCSRSESAPDSPGAPARPPRTGRPR